MQRKWYNMLYVLQDGSMKKRPQGKEWTSSTATQRHNRSPLGVGRGQSSSLGSLLPPEHRCPGCRGGGGNIRTAETSSRSSVTTG